VEEGERAFYAPPYNMCTVLEVVENSRESSSLTTTITTTLLISSRSRLRLLELPDGGFDLYIPPFQIEAIQSL